MTLVEVVAGLALLGSVLVALLLARAAYLRQWARADRQLQAVAAADELLTVWHRSRHRCNPKASGLFPATTSWHGGPGLFLGRSRRAGRTGRALGSFGRALVANASPVLATVDFVVAPADGAPLAGATTRPSAPVPELAHRESIKGWQKPMRRAFTLLELLAATALSALLMVAVLHVLGTIGRDRQTRVQRPEPQVWQADLLDTLHRDLAGSTGWRSGKDLLILTGQSALDRRTLAPCDEPVTLRYGITALHGRNWLFRRQIAE